MELQVYIRDQKMSVLKFSLNQPLHLYTWTVHKKLVSKKLKKIVFENIILLHQYLNVEGETLNYTVFYMWLSAWPWHEKMSGA